MTEALVNPATGEQVSPDDLEALQKAHQDAERLISAAYAETRDALRATFDMRDRLRVRIADLAGPYALPSKRRKWSPTQEKVAMCPRCGEFYASNRAG